MKRQGARSQKRSRAPPIAAGATEQGARVSTPEARPHHGHDTVLPITPVSDNVRRYDEQLAFVPPHATTGGGYDATSRSAPEDYHRRRRCRGCMCTVSTFCFVGVMTLAVPMVIFLLPYIRISLFVSATTDDLGQQTTSKLSPNPSTKPLPITLTASLRPVPTATIITAPPKPDACLGPSPDVLNGDNLTDLVHNFYPNRPSAPPGSTQPIYCIYNVSRFRRPNGYSFLPMHLPMSLCPNIVYWSWRLSGGNMSSRAKVFDKKYGLSVIGQAARDQGSSIDIILTIGGFPEDSADFHRVHDDEITQQRLIQSVYATILQYNLSGINLHWVQNDDSCERSLGDGVPRLEEFVIKLRALLAINGRSRNFSISTFVDPRDSFQMEFFRALGNQVNITFFRMHDLAPLNDFDQFCGNSIQTFQAYIQAVTPYFRPHIRVSSRPAAPPPHVNKLCISFSLALYARQGFSMNLPSPPQPVTATAGYIGLFEVCDSQLTFKEKVKRTPGCLARRTSGVLLNVAFVFEDVVTLRAKMSMLGPKNVSCALVYDIDFDNFRAGCYGSNDYLMLQHFYSARQNTSKFNISAFLP